MHVYSPPQEPNSALNIAGKDVGTKIGQRRGTIMWFIRSRGEVLVRRSQAGDGQTAASPYQY